MRTFRSPAATAAWGALLLVGLAALAAASRQPAGPVELLARTVVVVAPAALALAPLACPSVRLGPDTALVRGVVRWWSVPWACVAAVRQGWFAELLLADGTRVRVLALPVVGSMVAFRQWSVGDDDMFLRDSVRLPAHPRAGASVGAELLESYRAGAAPAPGAQVRTGPRSLVLASGLGLAVVAVAAAALLLAGGV